MTSDDMMTRGGKKMTKDTSPQLSMIIFSHLLLHPHLKKVFFSLLWGGGAKLGLPIQKNTLYVWCYVPKEERIVT